MKNIYQTKKILLLMVVMAATVAPAGAQTFFPMKKGAVLEYRYYDAKDNPLRDPWRNERWMRLTVEDMWGDSIANVVIANETFERLASVEMLREIIDATSYGDVRQTSDGVVFENVMWTFMSESLPQTSSDVDKVVKSNDMMRKMTEGSKTTVALRATAFVPHALSVGDTLPDAKYEAIYREEAPEETLVERDKMIKEAKEAMSRINIDQIQDESLRALFESVGRIDMSKNMTTTQTAVVRNRRVEAFEKVGDYECCKISCELIGPTERTPGIPRVQMQNGMPSFDWSDPVPVIMRYVDYLSPEVGLVRREKYNFRGNKIEEVMKLTAVSY